MPELPCNLINYHIHYRPVKVRCKRNRLPPGCLGRCRQRFPAADAAKQRSRSALPAIKRCGFKSRYVITDSRNNRRQLGKFSDCRHFFCNLPRQCPESVSGVNKQAPRLHRRMVITLDIADIDRPLQAVSFSDDANIFTLLLLIVPIALKIRKDRSKAVVGQKRLDVAALTIADNI